MKIAKVPLTIPQGSSYRKSLRWTQSTIREVLVESVSAASPAVITTQTDHGLPTIQWPIVYEGRRYDFVGSDILALRLTDTTIELPFSTLLAPPFRGPAAISYRPPMDLTGCTARAQFRAEVDSDEVLLSLTTENGGIEIDPQGLVVLVFKDTDTDGAEWRNSVFDVEVVFSTGDPIRFVEGPAKLDPNVTREVSP